MFSINIRVEHHHFIHGTSESRGSECATTALLAKINFRLDTIMATEAQLIADLEAIKAQQTKTITEIQSVQTATDALKVKITELEAIIASGSAPSQALSDAVAAVKAGAQLVDDQIPDIQTN